jgi:hypothetical protein
VLIRRILGVAVALACVGLLSSCSLLPPSPADDDSKQRSDVEMQQIADAVKNHDAAGLKKVFSSRARQKATDLDKGLAYFLSVFPSGKMTWVSEGTAGAGDNEWPKETEELYANYEVFANGKKYDLYFADFTVDTAHPDYVGFYALGVAPHTTDPYTASGAKKPFDAWASQFHTATLASGEPGVYIPQK